VWAAPAAADLDALTTRNPRLAERLHTALGVYALTSRGDIRPLQGRPELRLRVGSWRILFRLDTARREVHVLSLADRRDAYRP
jgi:mRNA interferase RelE/StbE